jgi:hypothetical protein
MEDYAAAFQLSIMNPIITKSKPVDNWQGKTDYNQANVMKRVYANFGLRASQNTLVVENEFKSQMDYAREHGGEFNPSQEVVNKFALEDRYSKKVPNKFVLSPDGKTVTYSGNGVPETNITTETYFGRMVDASGVKTGTALPSNPKPTNKPTGVLKFPDGSTVDIKASGLTDDQIKAAIKAGAKKQ